MTVQPIFQAPGAPRPEAIEETIEEVIEDAPEAPEAPEHEHSEPEPMVLAQPELLLPEGQRFWTDDSMFTVGREGLLSPHFSVQEVSKVFFGNGPDWLRWRMRPDDKKVKDPETGEWKRNEDGSYVTEPGDYPHGYFVLDGEPLEFKRTDHGARYFTLADVERMGHALAQGGHIDGGQLTNIVILVKTVAKIYGILA